MVSMPERKSPDSGATSQGVVGVIPLSPARAHNQSAQQEAYSHPGSTALSTTSLSASIIKLKLDRTSPGTVFQNANHDPNETSNSMAQTFFSEVFAATIILDLTGNILFRDIAVARLFHIRTPKGDVDKVHKLLTDESIKILEDVFQKAAVIRHNNQVFFLENMTGIDQNGGEFPFEMAASRIGPVEHPFLIGKIRDLRGSLETQNGFKHNAANYESLLSSIPGIIYQRAPDPAGTMLMVTDGVELITGYPASDFLERGASLFLDLVHPKDRDMVKSAYHRALHEKKPFKLEYELIQADNTSLWVCERGQPILDSEGAVWRVNGTIFCIEEQKRRETALFLEKKTADLANKEKSAFLANMSHEMRTPLHAILSFGELELGKLRELFEMLGASENEWAGEDGKDSNAPQIQTFLKKILHYSSKINQNSSRLTALIDNILDLSKLEVDEVDFDFQTQDMLALAKLEAEGLESLIEDKKLNLQIISPPKKVSTSIWCDGGKMIQVLRNLLSNAIKFSPVGGTITITFSNVKLKKRPALSICVSDQGIGIPPKETRTIFKKFNQSSKTKHKDKGTGLGLAICQQIILKHQGGIRADNNVDGGAKLTVTLPRKSKEIKKTVSRQPRRDPLPLRTKSRGQKKKHLYVNSIN